MARKRSTKQISIQSILAEVKTANPGVSLNEIVDELKGLIIDILPIALRRVRLPLAALDPFELRRRELMNLRRSKAVRERQESIDPDLLALIKSAKTVSTVQDSSQSTGTSVGPFRLAMHEGVSLFSSGDLSNSSPIGTQLISSGTSLAQSVHTGDLQSVMLSDSIVSQSDQGETTVSLRGRSRFEIDRGIVKSGVTSEQVKMFSIIETEARKMELETDVDIYFHLARSQEQFTTPRYTLKLIPSPELPLREFNSMADELERRIKRNLAIVIESVPIALRTAFDRLVSSFSVTLDFNFHDDWFDGSALERYQFSSHKGLIAALAKKSTNGELLILEDLDMTRSVLTQTDSASLLEDMLSCLTTDIRTRKTILGVDCLKELYRDEQAIGELMKQDDRESFDIRALIHEALNAVSLNEYARQHSKLRDSLIQKRISYETFVVELQKLKSLADKVWTHR